VAARQFLSRKVLKYLESGKSEDFAENPRFGPPNQRLINSGTPVKIRASSRGGCGQIGHYCNAPPQKSAKFGLFDHFPGPIRDFRNARTTLLNISYYFNIFQQFFYVSKVAFL